MKTMLKHLVLYALTLAAMLLALELALPAHGQYIEWRADPFIFLPHTNGNGTNVLAIYDKTGTNAFRINPTNAVPQIINGTNLYSGTNATVAVTNSARILIFKRGLLVEVQ